MDWKDIAATVGKAAPLLGTLLTGPVGSAVAVGGLIASALGTGNSPEEVSAALTNPDALLKLKQIEADRQTKLAELAADQAQAELQIAAGDRDSARKMQIAKPSPLPAVLSVVVTVGYFGVLIGMMTGLLVVADSQVLLMMLGSLTTAWGVVMAFWFGTTRDSARKTDLLAKSAPVK